MILFNEYVDNSEWVINSLFFFFQETLVEGLQRKSFRHSVLREGQYVKEEDSVDV